jgi:C-terminal processing protease CtpA/Prc
MKKLFTAAMLFLSVHSIAQKTSTLPIDRLMDAGKIYGQVKYFHPYLQYKDINWDSAFIVKVPTIIAAKDKKDYAAALQDLFSVLKDPVTSVLEVANPTTPVHYSELKEEDGIVIITRDDYRAIVDNDTTHRIFQKAIQHIDKSEGFLFDLRPDSLTANLNEAPLQEAFGDTEILLQLFTGTVPMPSFRLVSNTIFKSEDPGNNAGYQADFVINRHQTIKGQAKSDVPMAFIINRFSELPIEAIALQRAGKAVILQEQGAGEIGVVPSGKFWITDSVLIRMRLGELVDDRFGIGFEPNIIVPASDDRAVAVAAAKDKIKSIKPIIPAAVVFDGFNSSNGNKTYSPRSFPSLGERVLAAAKIYSTIEYFYPNKHLWKHNWDSVYKAFLPKFIEAQDSVEYVRAVIEMYAYIEEGHGFVRHPLVNYPIRGGLPGRPSFMVEIVEGQLIISEVLDDSLAKAIGFSRGDIILEKDGVNALKEIGSRRKYYPASNYDAQSRYITNDYLRDTPGKTVRFKLKDAKGKIKTVSIPLLVAYPKRTEKYLEVLNRKPLMQFVEKDIGYVNMGKLTTVQVDSMFNLFKDSKGIILDLREHPRNAATLIAARLASNGRFNKKNFQVPGQWYTTTSLGYHDLEEVKEGFAYKGKAVVLINERTQSHGEASASWLNDAGAILIGSNTAGANGDIVSFFIPGGVRLFFSSFNTPMQGKGIVPDIYVKPTIEGIKEGKDEVLEKAIQIISKG